jgi:hypothetical protein
MFWSSPFWDVTQWMLVFVYERFGTPYRSHLQALYAYIRLSEQFCRALTVTVKYICHESVKIQAHELWIILPYGFNLRQNLRQTRRGVSV